MRWLQSKTHSSALGLFMLLGQHPGVMSQQNQGPI